MIDRFRGEKVLIAEDHELYRDGLYLLMTELFADATIKLAADYPQALAVLDNDLDISLAMLDIKLPGTKDLDGLKEIRARFPTLTIIVVSTIDFDFSIRQMMDLGVNGFIAKSTPKKEMKSAIIDILDGNIVVKSEKDGGRNTDLTNRQLDTLRFLAEGLSNKEISVRLGVSQFTAKEYVSNVITKLKASNRTHAVLIAQQQGLLIDHLH